MTSARAPSRFSFPHPNVRTSTSTASDCDTIRSSACSEEQHGVENHQGMGGSRCGERQRRRPNGSVVAEPSARLLGRAGTETLHGWVVLPHHVGSDSQVPGAPLQPLVCARFARRAQREHAISAESGGATQRTAGAELSRRNPECDAFGGPAGHLLGTIGNHVVVGSRSKCYEVETVLRRADLRSGTPDPYLNRFRRGEGLPPAETPAFTKACGFATEARATYPIRHCWRCCALMAHSG